MRKNLFRLMLTTFVLFCGAWSNVASAQDYASKMKLWYSSPSGSSATASNWMEYALPIGNGQLGATFIGNVDNEYLQFNEKTLWTGTKDQNNKGVTSESGSYYGSYQNFGYLTIKTGHSSSSYSGYKRELDLSTATGKVSYTSGGVQYTREFIASYPGNVVVARFSANQTGKQNLTISLTKGQGLSSGSVSYSNGTIGLSGNLETVAYGARIKVVNVNGTITTNSSNITVKNADEVYIILAAGTNFDASVASYVSGDANSVLSLADSRIAAAVAQGWDAVYSAHKDDYQALFGRVEFDLTGSTNTSATNSLIGSYSGGTSANDLMLDQLYFAYGRYLEIASSRGVGLPSNLQGIWCNTSPTYSTWNCDIHANINVQMNYWPAEATNLSEMHVPFLEWIINMANSAQWKQYAKNSGQSRGWTTFTENNIFGGVGYWMQNSTVQNAWFCSHLWQHFEYTRDEAFLAKAFPAMLGATQFWLDRLVLASDGTYECPNEYSPEHGPSSENGVAYAQQLVYELFDNTLKAVDVLGTGVISQTDLNDLKNKFAKLDKGLATEKFTASGSYGGFLGIGATKWANYANGVAKNAPLLREWKYSAYNCSGAKVEHRHLSHLMCMYPFSQVDANSGELFTAAKNSLQMRGDAATGWAMGWKINLWARALDGDHAHKILKSALTHSTTYDKNEKKGGVYYNLWSSHAPFQIDGNFGATAGMTEMLLQSHGGVLNILPAIPSQWKNGGSVKGLKGRGNFTVDFNWTSNGTVNNISIVNVKGEKCLVKCAGRDISAVYVAAGGRVVVPVALGNGVYEIPSKAGDTIEIDFNREPGKVESEEPAVAVETPAFSIAGGEVEEGTTVTISCATEGATVYYTTDGTEPTTSSAVYSGAITVNKAMTIKAMAAKEGNYTDSEIVSAAFTIKPREVVKTPVFSVAGGEVEEGTKVTISCATEGATVYYTTDGTTPTTSSAVYNGAIIVNKAMTIKAVAAKNGYYTNSEVASASFTIKAREVVKTPVFSIGGGEVEAGTMVTISCATSGATIYYTTDGSTPTTSSAVYSGAITVNKAMTIKAMAAKSGYYSNSSVATAVFTIKAAAVAVSTPVFSIAGGEVEEGTKVTISCATSGATVYYTTDGTTPTTSSAVYNGAITVNKAMTIKAMAAKSGNYLNSSVVTASYTIKAREVVATPVINPAGGEVEAGAGVTISCATSGATIYYTTDGTTPTTSSTVYSSAIAVNNAMTIKAMAAKSGYYTNSAVATATFTIRQTVVEPEKPVIDEALQQAIVAAQGVSAYTGVGYPSSSAATRVALDNAIAKAQAGNATASDLQSAVSAFKNEVNDIQMPEDGVTYKFVNVAKNGTKYYIKYASSGISMVTDESQATEYTCEAIGGDEYVFVASDGKYLIWKGPNGSEGFLFWKKTHGYNSNKGYNASYNSTYCDLIVEKLTNETSTVSASSNADLFGMMTIQGMRYSRSEYSYFTIKKDGTFDASVTPYYNGTYSSAFYIVATGTAAKGSRIEGTTAVEEVAVERVADDAIYDLTGRKVTEMRAGEIYIQNGKKILKR